jgi:hypothetical protein
MADSANNLIREFDASGNPVTTYGNGIVFFKQPCAVAVDSTGTTIFIADSGNNQIQTLTIQVTPAPAVTPQATPVTIVTANSWGSSSLLFPEGIAISATNVYVSDTLNNKVVSFKTDGTGQTTWGGPGSGNLQFSGPIGIAYSSSSSISGNLFIADYGNNRIQVLSSSGSYLSQFGSSSSVGGNGVLKGPEGVAVAGVSIFVSDTSDNLVQVFK